MREGNVNFTPCMTPLILITGFLGAGKTTLLRALIPELRKAGLDPSLVLNDYQNARIDAELFREVAADVRPISGSCVCCGSLEELIEQLVNFSHREKSVMLIEANGTTDTPELVEHLTAHPKLRTYSLPIQIAVVDGKRWQKRFWHNELERQQVRTATHFCLTRRDEVKPDRIGAVEMDLARMAPLARSFDLSEFGRELAKLEEEIRPNENRAQLFSLTQAGRRIGLMNAGHAHSHFASAEFALPEVVDRGRLEHFLNELPPEVMRAKGLVRFQIGGPWTIFQKVEQSRDIQVVEIATPPAGGLPVLIVVGPRLDVDAMSRTLAEWCRLV